MITKLFLIILFFNLVSLNFAQTECKLNNITVVPNFKPELFAGSWFEIKRQTASGSKIHNDLESVVRDYTFMKDGLLKMELRGRNITSDECVNRIVYGTLENNSAKMKIYSSSGGIKTYWIIDSDYNTYSIIFGCSKESSDGWCDKDYQNSFIMSKQSDFNGVSDVINTALAKICLSADAFIPSSQAKEPCPENKCHIGGFNVEQNLDFEKLKGVWYQDKERVMYRRERKHHVTVQYKKATDTSMEITFKGRDDNNECHTRKLNARLKFPNMKNGRFETDRGGAYWIISTDYENYNIVYSCGEKYLNGSCIYNETSAWVLSKNKTIPEDVQPVIKSKLLKICLTDEDLETTIWNLEPCAGVGLRSYWLWLLGALLIVLAA